MDGGPVAGEGVAVSGPLVVGDGVDEANTSVVDGAAAKLVDNNTLYYSYNDATGAMIIPHLYTMIGAYNSLLDAGANLQNEG